jgi:hypothetical protein
VDDLIKPQFTLGLQSSGGEALCNGSEDSGRPQSVPAVEVDDMPPVMPLVLLLPSFSSSRIRPAAASMLSGLITYMHHVV